MIVDNDFCVENGINVTETEFAECFTDGVLWEAFALLAEEMAAQKAGDATAVTAIRYRVMGILLRLCREHLYTGRVDERPDSHAYTAVRSAIRYLREAEGKVTLEKVAAHAHMSTFHLSHEFKRITGVSVFSYLNAYRCDRARHLIRQGVGVSEAAAAVGFDNLSYFSRTFKRYIGVLPSACPKK